MQVEYYVQLHNTLFFVNIHHTDQNILTMLNDAIDKNIFYINLKQQRY